LLLHSDAFFLLAIAEISLYAIPGGIPLPPTMERKREKVAGTVTRWNDDGKHARAGIMRASPEGVSSPSG